MTQKKLTQRDAKPRFYAALQVIVEAEDWNEAFDYLDELTHAEVAAYDAKIVSSTIDYLKQTEANGVGSRSTKRDLKAAGMS